MSLYSASCNRGVDLVRLQYSFRIDPAPGQRMALAKAFGCPRGVQRRARAAHPRPRP
ncbi:helix-turn-helix domain-containing protein [Nonomuraea sp. NPDC049709]|uniref:helix-turn-helix domain-containing protein n=1 Tax=Nonomuraea sp. NPDC049709 TaxID=3154736 RepID=UPI00342A4AC3